jgi:hypothetical protein
MGCCRRSFKARGYLRICAFPPAWRKGQVPNSRVSSSPAPQGYVRVMGRGGRVRDGAHHDGPGQRWNGALRPWQVEFGERRDWMAVEPVCSEPVSAPDSLINREFTGNLAIEIGSDAPLIPTTSRFFQLLDCECQKRTGNLFRLTGNPRQHYREHFPRAA